MRLYLGSTGQTGKAWRALGADPKRDFEERAVARWAPRMLQLKPVRAFSLPPPIYHSAPSTLHVLPPWWPPACRELLFRAKVDPKAFLHHRKNKRITHIYILVPHHD